MSNPNPMQHLDTAAVELHAMVDAFKARWLAGRAENPDHYPLEMSDGDWFEAFLVDATLG